MIFYSIIIPVYNVTRYIENCVNSIVSKRIPDSEIILVDDGSTDESGIFCDKYALLYNCIKVIHKNNAGLSSARNAGLMLATGKYVSFVDSDDWWNPEIDVNIIIKKIKSASNAEMYLFSSLDYYEGRGLFKRKEHDNLQVIRTDSVVHYYQDLLKNGNLEVSAATKIIDRDFLLTNDLKFMEGLLSEDNEWMLRLLRVLTSVSIINEPLYICRMGRQGSITNTIGKKNITDLLKIIQSSITYYTLEEDKHVKKYELDYCSYLWFCALGLSCQLEGDLFSDLKEDFRKTSSICSYSSSPKAKASYMVYRLFGLNFARKALGLYIKVKQRYIVNRKKTELS